LVRKTKCLNILVRKRDINFKKDIFLEGVAKDFAKKFLADYWNDFVVKLF